MALSTAMSRGQSLLRDLMRASLGNHVNTLILEKAATLELRHFEDADFYDKMQNARREASSAAAVHGAGDGFARCSRR